MYIKHMHFCIKLGITYIKLGFSVRDMRIPIAKLRIAHTRSGSVRVGILAQAKFWLSPGTDFWLLKFRRLPVFIIIIGKKHPPGWRGR